MKDGLVDWQRIVFDLTEQGMSPKDISVEVDSSRTAVLRWRDSGGEPLFRFGMRLLRLWAARTGADPEQPPLVNS